MIELIILYLVIATGITYGYTSISTRSTTVCIIGSILFGWWLFPLTLGILLYKKMNS